MLVLLIVVPKASVTTRRSSLAMGTLRRSAVGASPEAGDRTWMRHWRGKHAYPPSGAPVGSLALVDKARTLPAGTGCSWFACKQPAVAVDLERFVCMREELPEKNLVRGQHGAFDRCFQRMDCSRSPEAIASGRTPPRPRLLRGVTSIRRRRRARWQAGLARVRPTLMRQHRIPG